MRLRLIIFGMLASSAIAQVPVVDSAKDDIVVEGRNGAVLRSYVDRVARPELGHQLARWNAPLCVRYDGLGQQYADYIQARLVRAAREVGVRVAGPGCQTDVLVKLTDEADGLARAFVRMHPRKIGNLTDDSLLPKREAAAIEAPRTVRWLTASATVNRDGVPFQDGVSKLYTDSLIRSSIREDIASKIILIDAARLANVSLNQLADYLAFVTLASPDIAADYAGTDSIMAVFAGGDGPRSMTGQDRAFLDALYKTPADRPATNQKSAIRARIRNGG
jgi:hypothetical protein